MDNTEKINQIREQVLKGVKSKHKDIQLDKWFEYLENNLSFPFEAKVLEAEGASDLSCQDIVKVKNINDYIDPYGILLEIRKGRRKYIFPLCDLEVVDKQSENHFITQAYLDWWSNVFW